MNVRMQLIGIACMAASLPALAQAEHSHDAESMQKQCTAVADYSKLPQAQAKQCALWAEEQQEVYAQLHLGGIEEADEDARMAARTASAQLEPLLAKLTPAQRSAYGQLLKAFQHFLALQVSGGYLYLQPYAPAEWDGGGKFASGYLHAQFDTAVTRAIVHRADLPGIYAGGPGDDLQPSGPSPALGEADARLNAAWKHLGSDLVESHQEASFNKLQIEQRAWLKLRDAFVAFAARVSPTIPSSSWAASLEATRAEELSLLDSMTASARMSRSNEPR